MTGIVPALKPNDSRRAISQQVDNFPLAFVTPLGTDDNDVFPHDVPDPSIAVREPMVERDLDAIRASGVLRILTRNNSSSYLILRGEELGFEYELARAFSRELNVKLEVVLADSQSSMLSMFYKSSIDFTCSIKHSY